MPFFDIQYLANKTSILTETFRTFLGPRDLFVGKVSALNSFIRFFYKYLAGGQNFSKLTINLERRPSGTNPLGVFLYTMSPAYKQNMSSNRGYQLVSLPRQFLMLMSNMIWIFFENECWIMKLLTVFNELLCVLHGISSFVPKIAI